MALKNISAQNERDWYLVDEWKTSSGLTARIHQCVWHDNVKKISSSLHDFYTGYVQVPEGVKVDADKIDVHGGITFDQKPLKSVEGTWVGFDLAHYGDEDKQDLEYVKGECEKLASQISK